MNQQPIKIENRIVLLDVYRGFAIFGIFVVNIVIMNSTFLNQDEFAKQWTSNIDQIIEKIVQLFFYTKFFPIFSLLFGLGISMQVLRLMKKDKFSFSFFGRRMLILFAIGVLHITFLWSGDVLNLYAILGLLIMFIIKWSNKVILILSVILLCFPFYDFIFEQLFSLLNFKPEIYLSDYTGEIVNEIISNGSYSEGIKLRWLEYFSNIPMLFGFLAPIALSMFLLGLYLGKNNTYNSLEIVIQKIKRPMVLIAILTNVYRIIFLFVLVDHKLFETALYREGFIKIMVISDTIMGLFYLWIIGWMWYNTKLKTIFLPLQYVGRMALTNYILQSFIGLILFTSVGFSLYETLSPSETLLTAILVFIVQLILSKYWLSYFRFGPLEWIWRCLSYKELLAIKKSTSNNTIKNVAKNTN